MIYKITIKDWNRAQDLVEDGRNEESAATRIKDVNKLAARYVAGLKLLGIVDIKKHRYPWDRFECFIARAIKLGAKVEDIVETFENTSIPENFREEKKPKKTYSGYLGSLERLIDKMIEKYSVEITKEEMLNGTQGKWWSEETDYSYGHNGRCWPLNYWVKVSNGKDEFEVPIIVVTNEGGGLYGYDYEGNRIPFQRLAYKFEKKIRDFLEVSQK